MKGSAVLVFLISLMACVETPPFIDYSKPILLSRDTTYSVSPIPPPQLKNVLIEDISGVRCVNCPEAAEIAHDIVDKHAKGRINVLTLHSTKFAVYTRPIIDTFNTKEATDIIHNLIGEPLGLPIGAVDRKIFAGKTDPLLSPATWESYVNQQLLLDPQANLELSVIPNKANRTAIVNIKVTVLEPIADPVHLSIFISESHIKSPQKTLQGEVSDFEHNFILRKGITSYNGLKLADNLTAGTVFEKGFEVSIPDKWVYDNCEIMVLVNKVKSEDNVVLQSASKSLKP